MKKQTILLVLAFAVIIRVWSIELAPPSLNWDEVSHGYNAYSILATGRDEWGEKLPIIFRAFGDYKLPVYIYLTALSEGVLGLSTLAVRLPSILAGVATVFFAYLLTKKLLKNENTALLAAALVAVEPWSLFLSRIAVEANVALGFIVAGFYYLLLGLEKKNYNLVAGMVLLGLSVWTYNSARIFVPLVLLATTVIYRGEFLEVIKRKKRIVIFCILVAVAFFTPMFIQLGSKVGQARYEKLQILDQAAIGRIIELRNSSGIPDFPERLLFNRVTYFASQFGLNYVKHFSPEFLYFQGGDNYQFNIPGHGLLFLVGAPFFVLGLWRLVQHWSKSDGKFLVAWLLIAPVTSSLTQGSPHTLRSIVMLPIPMVLTALGAVYVFERFTKQRWLAAFFIVFVFLGFADYFDKYLNDYRNNYSWSWQYGYKEAINVVKANYDNYEKIVITKKYGEPHEFLLYYWPWEPGSYQADEKIRYFQSNWYWVDKFDKFYFVNDWDIPKVGSEFTLESGSTFDCASCLLVSSPGNAPENWKKVDTINFLSGEAAFEIYEH